MADLAFREASPSPRPHDLAPGEVHVWVVDLQEPTGAWDSLLSASEAERARRLSPMNERSFRNRRGILRLLLGRYLGQDPVSIELAVGPYGKPCLAGRELNFNVSYSAGVSAIAVGRGCVVGIDIEGREAPDNPMQLAAQFFTLEENQRLSNVPHAILCETFMRMWTRKEAVLKAAGAGIRNGVEVAVPDRLSVDAEQVWLGAGERKQAYFLYDVDTGAGFVAAVAVSCRASRIVSRWIKN